MVRLYAMIMQPSLLFPNNSQKTPKFIQKNLRKKSLLHKTLRFFEKKIMEKIPYNRKHLNCLEKKILAAQNTQIFQEKLWKKNLITT